MHSQISNRGRYRISNINQQLAICKHMLKVWCIHLFLFLQCCGKIWCIYSIFFVFQFGRLKLAPGAIYLYLDICGFTGSLTFIFSVFSLICFSCLYLYFLLFISFQDGSPCQSYCRVCIFVYTIVLPKPSYKNII